MKDYKHFGVEEFVCDDAFIQWCLQPDAHSNTFWQDWMLNHPDKVSILKSAKTLVLDLNAIEKENQNSNFEQEIWKNIEKNINQPKKKIRKLNRWKWSSAAAILVIILSYFIIQQQDSPVQSESEAITNWVNFENNSANIKHITLADGSKISLEPFSALKYPTTFSETERKVFLKGEAFFDIERDETKPFLIYANETITKVLGTSFTIKAFEGQKTVEVDVKTGKVAVYARVASENQNNQQKKLKVKADKDIIVPLPNKKLIVTPNQKVVFDHKVEEMVKTLTEAPKVITELEELPQFQFNDESIVKVFEALEIAYGIDLDFDENKFKDCTITTSLGEETLFEKLTIIGFALDFKFTEKDAVIYIKGSGC